RSPLPTQHGAVHESSILLRSRRGHQAGFIPAATPRPPTNLHHALRVEEEVPRGSNQYGRILAALRARHQSSPAIRNRHPDVAIRPDSFRPPPRVLFPFATGRCVWRRGFRGGGHPSSPAL